MCNHIKDSRVDDIWWIDDYLVRFNHVDLDGNLMLESTVTYSLF